MRARQRGCCCIYEDSRSLLSRSWLAKARRQRQEGKGWQSCHGLGWHGRKKKIIRGQQKAAIVILAGYSRNSVRDTVGHALMDSDHATNAHTLTHTFTHTHTHAHAHTNAQVHT